MEEMGLQEPADQTYSAMIEAVMFFSRGWTILVFFSESVIIRKEADGRARRRGRLE